MPSAPKIGPGLLRACWSHFRPSIAEIEAAWAEEIEDRMNAFDQDEMSAHSAADVFGEARKTLR